MSFCSKCGKQLNEGDKFCTNCGTPVSRPRLRIKSFKIGGVDYRTLNNVKLVSKPSQHTVYHVICHLADLVALVYVLFFLYQFSKFEEYQEIEYVPGMFSGVSVAILIAVICGIIEWKIRYDIIHLLPTGFDRWKIRRILKWQILGFDSLKTAFRRLLLKDDCAYPELGMGTDDEGNCYAFVVPGEDVSRYPYPD